MNHYIKHIVEAFDFNTVKKDNRSLLLAKTAMDAAIEYKANDIVNNKILNNINPSDEDLKFLYSLIGIYKVHNKEELRTLIDCCIKILGSKCNLNWINISNITDMGDMFAYSKFNGDISNWDVRNVTNMDSMFSYSVFNKDISKWDVSKVINMNRMFCHSEFNGDISNWDVSNVTNMEGMFLDSVFNGDISKWDVSNVTDISYMFFRSKKFNGDISKWDVSNVTNMDSMFQESKFNKDISNWDVSNVKKHVDTLDNCPIKEKYKPKFKKI